MRDAREVNDVDEEKSRNDCLIKKDRLNIIEVIIINESTANDSK